MFSLKNLVIHCCISYFKSLSLSSLKFNVLPGLYLSAQCPDTVVLLPWWRQLECLSPCNMDPKHTQPMQARFAPSQHILHSYNIKWGFTKDPFCCPTRFRRSGRYYTVWRPSSYTFEKHVYIHMIHYTVENGNTDGRRPKWRLKTMLLMLIIIIIIIIIIKVDKINITTTTIIIIINKIIVIPKKNNTDNTDNSDNNVNCENSDGQ